MPTVGPKRTGSPAVTMAFIQQREALQAKKQGFLNLAKNYENEGARGQSWVNMYNRMAAGIDEQLAAQVAGPAARPAAARPKPVAAAPVAPVAPAAPAPVVPQAPVAVTDPVSPDCPGGPAGAAAGRCGAPAAVPASRRDAVERGRAEARPSSPISLPAADRQPADGLQRQRAEAVTARRPAAAGGVRMSLRARACRQFGISGRACCVRPR